MNGVNNMTDTINKPKKTRRKKKEITVICNYPDEEGMEVLQNMMCNFFANYHIEHDPPWVLNIRIKLVRLEGELEKMDCSNEEKERIRHNRIVDMHNNGEVIYKVEKGTIVPLQRVREVPTEEILQKIGE